MFLMYYEYWQTVAMCLNASRSRDVGDAIPYMVGVFHKDAIPYIVGVFCKDAILDVPYALRTLAN